MLLEDYVIDDSKIEKTQVKVQMPDSSGVLRDITRTVPGKVMAIRFKKILETKEVVGDDGEISVTYRFEKEHDADGNPSLLDAEYYCFTGSKILIDQAEQDFSKDDLPAPTVIQQFASKTGQTFFKFT